ncbi:hypothetical protein BX265_4955 [Streptomyces sp. TLI_235]|nr:hypothetical protein [Streptomyces sp. TLI_235]PBC80119.1 hypothetical protein BX265_4955 [Streptomyces sp. TLI_235]
MFTPFQHPLASHAPGTILGYRRDGRPIYPIAGGNGEGEGAAAGSPAPVGEPAAPTGEQPPAGASETPKPTPPAKSAAAPAGEDQAAVIARLEQQLAAARKDAGASRVNAKQQAADEARTALAQEIGKALGLVKDDTPPDPAKLAEQITSHTAKIGELETALRARDVELAVHSAAEKHQAKVSALLDSRSFVKTIGALDPTAKTFTADLDAAIKQAVDSNPNFRIAPQAGRSGAELTGGPGESGKARPTSLGAALRGLYGT